MRPAALILFPLIFSVATACSSTKSSDDAGRPGSPSGLSAVPALRGEVTDPAGDATVVARVPISPDLVSGAIVIEGDAAVFTVEFAPGTFNAATSTAQFALDLDENPSTGNPDRDFGIGIDFLVNFGWNDDGTVRLMRQDDAADVGYETVGSVPSTTTANGFRATVPLASLDGDDGRVTFRVTASSRLSAQSFTGILDYMPDPGLAAAAVR